MQSSPFSATLCGLTVRRVTDGGYGHTVELSSHSTVLRFSAAQAVLLGDLLRMASRCPAPVPLPAGTVIPERMAQEFGVCAGATPEPCKPSSANDTRSEPMLSEWPGEAVAVAQHYRLDATNGGW